MRFMRIGNVYPGYWRKLYASRPGLKDKSYAEQIEALLYDSFSQSDSYCHYLRPLGYDCEEVIANVVPLQRQWARENGLAWNANSFVTRHPLEMARRFQPEIVFLNDFTVFGAAWVDELKRICNSIRLVIGWCAVGKADLAMLRGYDIVLTSSLALLERYRDAGLRVELLRHAFDPRILERTKSPCPRDIALSFVGNVICAPGVHDYRASVIKRLLQDYEIALYCPCDGGLLKTATRRGVFELANLLRILGVPQAVLATMPLLRRYSKRPLFRLEDSIQRASRDTVFGLDMFCVLLRSRITLNAHITASENSTGNIRLFEATGMGACLVTDWKEDLKDLFELDREVVAYRSPDECADKVRWLLDNPDRCAEIAAAGQRRTLRDHTYAQRAAELDELFHKALSRLSN